MVKMGYVWDRTVETLGDRLGVILPIAIFGIFLPSAGLTVAEGLRESAAPLLKIGLSLVSLVASLLSLWSQLAIIAAAIDPRRGPADATGTASRRLFPAIGVFLLLGIAASVLLIPAFVLLTLGGLDSTALATGQVEMSRLAPGFVGFAVLYALIAMIVILFVGARLAPVTSVVVEERRGAGAIAHAFRLTRGLTWRLVGVLLLYAIVTMVSVLAVQTVLGTILRLFDSGTGPITMTGVVTAIAAAAVSAVFTVLASVFCARLYVAIVGASGMPVAAAPASAAPMRDEPRL
ncbi:MAG TPA: hypothetical protein VFO80_00770 [Sphingomonas sp.]|nr:hypothetical protein [Sphingomonas sp.]